MAKRNRSAYRDTKTGRFASKATWNRSRSRGGTRYQKIKVAAGVQKRRAEVPSSPIPTETKSGGGGGGSTGGPKSNVISSLQDYYDFEDFDYYWDEFETGVDY